MAQFLPFKVYWVVCHGQSQKPSSAEFYNVWCSPSSYSISMWRAGESTEAEIKAEDITLRQVHITRHNQQHWPTLSMTSWSQHFPGFYFNQLFFMQDWHNADGRKEAFFTALLRASVLRLLNQTTALMTSRDAQEDMTTNMPTFIWGGSEACGPSQLTKKWPRQSTFADLPTGLLQLGYIKQKEQQTQTKLYKLIKLFLPKSRKEG